MRSVIYSRYSTDLQDRSSIDGQVSNCESIAILNGWKVVRRYSDEAFSGGDDNRPGYMALLADSEAGKFDCIIVDETSRITRRPGELPRLLETLQFRNQFLLDCKGFDSRHETASLLASIYGGIDSLELRKIKERTHRGLRERSKAGFSAGGKTFGYDSEPIDAADPESKKRLIIVPHQADIVREIFQRFASGESAKSIASELNTRGIPSPGASWNRTTRRAKGWTGSAIVGTARMFTGILRRELYIGRNIWNRRKSKKVPGTSKRVYEIRPESEWIITDHPDLRIIDDVLWHKVQTRLKQARANAHPNQLRRRGRPSRYLLSGLMVCGECGANFIMQDRRAYGCSSHTNGGKSLCNNRLRVKRQVAETVMLKKIKERLLADDLVEYVQARIRDAIENLSGASDAATLKAEVDFLSGKIDRLVEAIETMGVSDTLAQRLKKLELEKRAAEARLKACLTDEEPLAALPDMIPHLMKSWIKLVRNIEQLPDNPNATENDLEQARTHLGALLGKIEIRSKNGVPWAFPSLKTQGLANASPVPIILVAGAGFEPATFGL